MATPRLLLCFLLCALALLNGVARAAAPDFLVDAAWLESRLKDPKLVILEVRYHPHRYFTVGHIPGAVQVQRFKDLGDNGANPIMRIPSLGSFQATLRQLGVNDDSTVLIYDDSRSALAARLFALLALYGFDMSRVKILDGGTVEWSAFNDLDKSPVRPKPGKVSLKPANTGQFVEWPAVYDDVLARRDPKFALIDARPKEMYTGKLIRHSVQGGHIPGAINIVSLDGTDAQSQKWLSLDKLTEMYRAIPKDNTVYVYCHDGFRMSLGWLQLKSLGYRDVRMLNGGWGAWDRALTLPVVTGEAPYDDEFSL